MRFIDLSLTNLLRHSLLAHFLALPVNMTQNRPNEQDHATVPASSLETVGTVNMNGDNVEASRESSSAPDMN